MSKDTNFSACWFASFCVCSHFRTLFCICDTNVQPCGILMSIWCKIKNFAFMFKSYIDIMKLEISGT